MLYVYFFYLYLSYSHPHFALHSNLSKKILNFRKFDCSPQNMSNFLEKKKFKLFF